MDPMSRDENMETVRSAPKYKQQVDTLEFFSVASRNVFLFFSFLSISQQQQPTIKQYNK